IIPPAIADPIAGALQHSGGEENIEIVAVDPFHFENANSIALDKVLHVEQVVVLNLCHPATDLGDTTHGVGIVAFVEIALGRKELKGHGKREFIGPPPLAEIHGPLPTRAEQAAESQVTGPGQSLAIDEGVV